jgi:hypothetical protein
MLGRDLSAAYPELQTRQLGNRGNRDRHYIGIRLRQMGLRTLCSLWVLDFNDVPARNGKLHDGSAGAVTGVHSQDFKPVNRRAQTIETM